MAVTQFTHSVAGTRWWRRRRIAAAALVCVVLGGIAGWGCFRVIRGQRYQLRMLRQAIGTAAAPDELVVVDDRVLGWALVRSKGRDGLENLQVTADDVAPSSLLVNLEDHRREIVVVARPTARLLRTLSAAGYVLVLRAGSDAWAVGGRGQRLLGWGEMRIFFVRLRKDAPAPAVDHGAAVSSQMQDAMHHKMK